MHSIIFSLRILVIFLTLRVLNTKLHPDQINKIRFQLTLPLKSSNNDFSPDTLNRVKDCIYLHLFDEVTIDLIEDEREDRSSIVHHRIDRRWLGSLTIPFSSLYRNTRIEGIKTFGFEKESILKIICFVAIEFSTFEWNLAKMCFSLFEIPFYVNKNYLMGKDCCIN